MTVSRCFLLGMLFAAVSSPATAQSCQEYFSRAQEAANAISLDIRILRELTAQVRNSERCSQIDKTCFASLASDVLVSSIRPQGSDPKPSAKAGRRKTFEADMAIAEEAYEIAATWRAAWTLAHFRQVAKDFDEAAVLYQRAYAAIAEVRVRASLVRQGSFVCPGEVEALPNVTDERDLVRLTIQANALSTKFVQQPPTRCGQTVVRDALQIECAGAKRIPLPVEFDTDSDRLTVKGKDAVTYLAKYMLEKGATSGSFVLTGHSDQWGSRQFNCSLSKRRLASVIADLHENGIGPEFRIEAIAMGSSDPFPIVDVEGLSKNEVAKINRRVELRELEGEPPRECVSRN